MAPVVSVKTITYNHALYIGRCIESIIMQKTTFPFELVIGEDCSTDGTREIVMDYAKKYPEIIRVITSEKNVGGLANSKRTNNACQGEYIALCEGDDYWIDPLKLQKQYDAIREQKAALVAHATFVIFYKDGKSLIEAKVRKAQDISGFVELKDILSHEKQFHTSSIFLRAEIIRNLPDWYYDCPIGDYPLKVISAKAGKVYFINEVMSIYQKGNSVSYTSQKEVSKSKRDEWLFSHEIKQLKMYANLDNYTDHQYTGLIDEIVRGRLVFLYSTIGYLDFLKLSNYQRIYLRWLEKITRKIPINLRMEALKEAIKHIDINY
jgi:glycosyltransferase involved in cell wall biosynthesis